MTPLQSPLVVGIDFSQLESKFNMEDQVTSKFEKKRSSAPKQDKAFELVDAKRTMAVNIFVKSLPVTVDALIGAL